MPTETRAAELSKLLDFFERLTSRSSRRTQATLVADTTDITPVVANIVNTRKGISPQGGKPKRPRRSTVTGSIGGGDREDCGSGSEQSSIISVPKFPLAKQYAFTFRHMLHKLYGRDDWLKKVQEALERSQSEFKPLAEKIDELEKDSGGSQVGEMAVEERGDHRINKEVVLSASGPGKRGGVRPRSFSVATVVKVDSGLTGYTDKEKGHGEVRALKRRCVGRRKSLSGLRTAEVGRVGGGWVYDGRTSRFEDRSYVDMSLRRRTRCMTLGGSAVVPPSVGTKIGKDEKIGALGQPKIRKRALTVVSSNVERRRMGVFKEVLA